MSIIKHLEGSSCSNIDVLRSVDSAVGRSIIAPVSRASVKTAGQPQRKTTPTIQPQREVEQTFCLPCLSYRLSDRATDQGMAVIMSFVKEPSGRNLFRFSLLVIADRNSRQHVHSIHVPRAIRNASTSETDVILRHDVFSHKDRVQTQY